MNISLNSIDDATLEYMVNVAQYEKYLRKNNLDYDTGFKKDLKFYRKRIISITKDLFKNEVKDVALNGAFNMYMKACISHLKFEDQSETIQKCYVCMGVVSGSSSAQQEQDKPCICNSNANALHAFELNKANELCFKPKEVKKLTLDTYVIKKSSSQKKEPVVFPQQFKFNPKDPSFKYKGLKKKKKEKRIVSTTTIPDDDDDESNKKTTLNSDKNK
jgi:hypothetical protein